MQGGMEESLHLALTSKSSLSSGSIQLWLAQTPFTSLYVTVNHH